MGFFRGVYNHILRQFESLGAKAQRGHIAHGKMSRMEQFDLLRQQNAQNSMPIPLPRLRRGLSIGREDVQGLGEVLNICSENAQATRESQIPKPIQDKRKTHMQLSSYFFKLPTEIRNEIYQYLLAGFMIRVAFWKFSRKMHHSRYISYGELWRFAGNQEFLLEKDCGWIAILRVCRRMYVCFFPISVSA